MTLSKKYRTPQWIKRNEVVLYPKTQAGFDWSWDKRFKHLFILKIMDDKPCSIYFNLEQILNDEQVAIIWRYSRGCMRYPFEGFKSYERIQLAMWVCKNYFLNKKTVRSSKTDQKQGLTLETSIFVIFLRLWLYTYPLVWYTKFSDHGTLS